MYNSGTDKNQGKNWRKDENYDGSWPMRFFDTL